MQPLSGFTRTGGVAFNGLPHPGGQRETEHCLRGSGLRPEIKHGSFVCKRLLGNHGAHLTCAQRLFQRCLCAGEQRHDMPGRHYEAHQLTRGNDGDIHAVHAAPGIKRRPSRHAPVNGTGVVDALIKPGGHQPVGNAFGNGQAQVQWKTDGVGAGSLGGNLGAQPQWRELQVIGFHDGQIVADIDGMHLQPAGAIVSRGVFQPVLLRVQYRIRHHVIVGNDQPVSADREAGAVKGAGLCIAKETANLNH